MTHHQPLTRSDRTRPVANALSVDVEEYYHAAIFRSGTRRLGTGPLESRVERNVDRLLEIFSTHRARATFFVLGEVARRHPAMVRRIAHERHEVGCHGHDHTNVTDFDALSFRRDIRRAKSCIEDVLGEPILGYRAPNFSIGGREQPWAYKVLLDEGFRYDSSVFPIHHDRYGQPRAHRFPHPACTDGSRQLVEFPIGTARVLGVNLPIGGGGYFRLFPTVLFKTGLRYVNVRERQPVMFYLHPWELDPDQPRPPMPWQNRFRHYVGIRRLAGKLGGLLADFQFRPAREVLSLTS